MEERFTNRYTLRQPQYLKHLQANSPDKEPFIIAYTSGVHPHKKSMEWACRQILVRSSFSTQTERSEMHVLWILLK